MGYGDTHAVARRYNPQMKDPVIVAVSGGFDPMHIGHIEMLEQARLLGDELVVIVNNDHWLKAKKGYAFMPEEERVALLERYPFVDRVVLTDHLPDDPDRSVSRTLEQIHPHIFANGGDRGETNTPEADVAERLGIEMAYGIGGGKVQSSSWMTSRAFREAYTLHTSWGTRRESDADEGWQLSTLRIRAGSQVPYESASRIRTIWMLVRGDARIITKPSSKSPASHTLVPGESIRIPSSTPYSISSETGCIVIHVRLED